MDELRALAGLYKQLNNNNIKAFNTAKNRIKDQT
jgi:hypothetical protein